MHILIHIMSDITLFHKKLKQMRSLSDEMTGKNKDGDVTLTTLVLRLCASGFQFTDHMYDKLIKQMMCKYCVCPKNDDQKKVIDIVMKKVKKEDVQRMLKLIRIGETYFVDVLFDNDWEFDVTSLTTLAEFGYSNIRLDSSVVFDKSMYQYVIVKLLNFEDSFFDNMVPHVKNVTFELIRQHLLLFNKINVKGSISRKFVDTLVGNMCIDERNVLINYVIQHNLKGYIITSLCKFENDDLFVNHLCSTNLIMNNIITLFDIDNYVTVDVINKMFAIDTKCSCIIDKFIPKTDVRLLAEFVINNHVTKIVNFQSRNVRLRRRRSRYNGYGRHFKQVYPNNKRKCVISFNIDDGNFIDVDVDNGMKIYYIDVMSLFEIFGVEPNLDTLNLAVKWNNVDAIDKLLELGIVPNKSTLDISVANHDINVIGRILNYGIKPDHGTLSNFISKGDKFASLCYFKNAVVNYYVSKEKLECLGKKRRIRKSRMSRYLYHVEKCKKCTDHNKNQMMNRKFDKLERIFKLLVKNGLIVDMKCIDLMLSIHMYVPKLEKYGIAYDEDLYYLCYINNCFPDEYVNKFVIDKDLVKARLFSGPICNVEIDGYVIESLLHNGSEKYLDHDVAKVVAVKKLLYIDTIPQWNPIKGRRRHVKICNEVKNYIIKCEINKDIMMKKI